MSTLADAILDSGDPSLFDVRSTAPGPQGALPITAEMLLARPSDRGTRLGTVPISYCSSSKSTSTSYGAGVTRMIAIIPASS
jgi:hypothetical protein